jgi:hypothetical protein
MMRPDKIETVMQVQDEEVIMRKHNGSADMNSGNGKQLGPLQFISGQRVPASGTYGLSHVHPTRPRVNLLKDRSFPRCSECMEAVEFEMLSSVPVESARNSFRLLMREP